MNCRLVSRTTYVWVTLLILLLTIPTMAAAYDQVGIYFDETFQDYTLDVPEANTIVTGYLVLNDPETEAGVAGWELCVGLEGPGMFLSWELEGQTINVETPPCFQVGVGDAPLPGGAQVLLATFTMLVQDPYPITLTVEPVNHPSIPGEMAYLTDDEPQEIRELYASTGEPAVAWINQGMPGAVIEPSEVEYQEVAVGFSEIRIVTVHNPGGGPLVLDIAIEGSDAFSLPSVSGPRTVYPGETLEIPVEFHPEEIQYYLASLTFGHSMADPVVLNGYGREPIAAWDVPSDLVFGDVPIGFTIVMGLIVANIGETPLLLNPSIAPDCGPFSILNPRSYTIQPGGQVYLRIAFTPEVVGQAHCELSLGSVIDSVGLWGSGHVAYRNYTLDPEHLIFPDTAVGMPVARNIHLTNTGELSLNLNISLAEPSEDFAIIHGSGVQILEPGEIMYIRVRFIPSGVGQFESEVFFDNDLIPNVSLSGAGVESNESCIVTPSQVNFGQMSQGAYYSQYFSVHNDGNINMTVTPEAHCSNTIITPGEATLAPGESLDFTVSHLAMDLGPWDCLITLGDGADCDVTCTGSVMAGPEPDENLVGLFFDDNYTENEIYFPQPGVLETHLVLFNPTDPNGISGWECRMEIVGQNCLLIGTQLMGEAVNVGDSPDFQVGLGSPLPWAEAVHLADFSLLLIYPDYEAYLHLLPILTPSIPNEMAVLSADHQELIPMRSVAGWSQVAAINPSGHVAVQAPAPAVAIQGSMVQLNWDVQAGSNTYLVYRRGETGAPEALFDEPMSAQDGQFIYRDNPVGFADGDVLHYSYAVIQNGAEVTRSPETDIVLSGLPMAVTRLLPNVPNPFNPMTEINFEMEKTGQARISIFDVSGRLVTTLVNEQLASGPHSRTWQGKDATGRQVPSGAYYLRMEAGGRVDHRKIMLLK